MKHLPAAAALALAATWLLVDPSETMQPEALAGLGASALWAVAALWAATGAGAAVLRWRSPETLDGPAGWLYALAVGIALQGAAMGLLAAGGLATRAGSLGVLVALACGWVARPGLRWPYVGVGAGIVGAAFLFPGLLEALAPPTDTDEIYYQLDLARRIAEGGHLLGGFAHPDGSRPLPVQLVHACLYAVGGEAAPRLWHLGLVAALVAGVRELGVARAGPGRGDLAALVLLGSWSFVREAGMAYNNHAVAMWLLLAADALLAGRWALMGWMAGLTFAAKYTAAPVLLGIGVVALWDGRRSVLAALPGLVLPVVPWLLRNVADGLHPLFPFAGWPDAASFVFVYAEKYGVGRAPLDWLLLPWNVLMNARTDTFAFLGRISLLWAAVIAAGALAARTHGAARRLGFIVLVGFVGWALGAQLLRYLLPLSAIAALLAAWLRPGWVPALLFLVSLPANLAPGWIRAAGRVAVATGNEPRETFLARELPAWSAIDFLRRHAPADASVAMLFAWHGYYVPQDVVLGSVEDHIPTRWWLWSHGDASLRDLESQGVDWLLVGDTQFLKKSYGFLSPEVLRAQFNEPVERLRALLLRDATRLYAQDRWEVWRLDARVDAPLDGAASGP